MAEVADFHLSLVTIEDDDLIETLDPLPHWSHEIYHHHHEDIHRHPFDSNPDPFPLPDPQLHVDDLFGEDEIEDQDQYQDQRAGLEIVGSDYESDDQVNLVSDLFERSTEQNDGEGDYDEFLSNPFAEEPFFRVVDERNEMGDHGIGINTYLEELGLGFDGDGEEEDVEEEEENIGFMVEECGSGSEFFVGRRRESESSEIRGNCLGIRSDTDSDSDIDFRDGEDEDDLGIPLCWDCLRLDDQRESIVEFEWEEVDEHERVDEREVLSVVIDADEDLSVSSEVVEGGDEIRRNLEWEVLLAVNNIERNPDSELDVDHDDYIYPAEYEMIFGQFMENENALRGSPPAAKSVIESLPSIVLTQDDVENKSGICAVCKDEISTEEQAKLLPCSHYYHGDCILPWLNIRNTCPVCRYELPTDDPEYERRRS